MKSIFVLCVVAVVASFVSNLGVAQSEVFIATETARGEWENGQFTPGTPEFKFRLEIGEDKSRAKLTEMIRLKNQAIVNQPVEYVVLGADEGNDFSSFLISEPRRNQTVLTLVGKPGTLATEILLLGEDFFEYCKASAGRLYVSSGTVKKPLSVEDDTLQELRAKIEKSRKEAR